MDMNFTCYNLFTIKSARWQLDRLDGALCIGKAHKPHVLLVHVSRFSSSRRTLDKSLPFSLREGQTTEAQRATSYYWVGDEPSVRYQGLGFHDSCQGDSGGPLWKTFVDEVRG